jgi:hypothetical protein
MAVSTATTAIESSFNVAEQRADALKRRRAAELQRVAEDVADGRQFGHAGVP